MGVGRISFARWLSCSWVRFPSGSVQGAADGTESHGTNAVSFQLSPSWCCRHIARGRVASANFDKEKCSLFIKVFYINVILWQESLNYMLLRHFNGTSWVSEGRL